MSRPGWRPGKPHRQAGFGRSAGPVVFNGSRRGQLRGRTNTNGNQQLLGTGCIPTNARIAGIVINSDNSGTPVTSVNIGNAIGGSQIAAAASLQSSVLANREELDRRVDELEREYAGQDVRRPDHWGGYRLVPDTYEFWQHRDNRLHDRLRYRRADGGWTIERLAP